MEPPTLQPLNVTCVFCSSLGTPLKFLSCNHFSCTDCLQKNKELITCPVCFQKTRLSGSSSLLPDNFLTTRLRQVAPPCHMCGIMGKETPCTHVCLECGREGLCEMCLKVHRNMAATKLHQPIMWEDYIKSQNGGQTPPGGKEVCSKHPERVHKFYCTPCATLICQTCATGIHRDHDFIEKGKIKQEKCSHLIKQLVHIKEKVKVATWIAQEEDEVTHALERSETLTNSIVERTDMLVAMIQERSKRLIAQVNEDYRQRIDGKRKLEHAKTYACHTLQLVEMFIKHSSTDEMIKHHDFIHNRLQKMHDAVAELAPPATRVYFNFAHPNDKEKLSMHLGAIFGDLKCSEEPSPITAASNQHKNNDAVLAEHSTKPDAPIKGTPPQLPPKPPNHKKVPSNETWTNTSTSPQSSGNDDKRPESGNGGNNRYVTVKIPQPPPAPPPRKQPTTPIPPMVPSTIRTDITVKLTKRLHLENYSSVTGLHINAEKEACIVGPMVGNHLHKISIFSVDGNLCPAIKLKVTDPSRLTTSGTNMYLISVHNNSVIQIDRSGNLLAKIKLPKEPGDTRFGLAVHPITDDIFLCSQTSGAIYHCGKHLDKFRHYCQPGVTAPYGLGLAPGRDLIITQCHKNMVCGFTPNKAQHFLYTGAVSPRGVDVDEHGQIFVADTGNHRVTMLTNTGVVIKHLITREEQGVTAPEWVSVHGDHLVVVHSQVCLDFYKFHQ